MSFRVKSAASTLWFPVPGPQTGRLQQRKVKNSKPPRTIGGRQASYLRTVETPDATPQLRYCARLAIERAFVGGLGRSRSAGNWDLRLQWIAHRQPGARGDGRGQSRPLNVNLGH